MDGVLDRVGGEHGTGAVRGELRLEAALVVVSLAAVVETVEHGPRPAVQPEPVQPQPAALVELRGDVVVEAADPVAGEGAGQPAAAPARLVEGEELLHRFRELAV